MPSNPPIDTSTFQLGPNVSDDAEGQAYLAEETRLIAEMREEAETFIRSFRWAPSIKDMLLAHGVGGIIALYLVRFEDSIASTGDRELWVVVGDLPSMYFVTDDTPTPAWAIDKYCELAEDWANTVIRGGDLSQVYPIEAKPTREHAQMLLSRTQFIREELLPNVD